MAAWEDFWLSGWGTSSTTVSPGSLALTWTGATPAVATPIQVSPAALSLSWAGDTPSVTTPVQASPAALAMTWAGTAPALGAGLLPAALAMTWAGAAPAIGLPVAVSPTALQITWVGAVPAVSGANSSTPTYGAQQGSAHRKSVSATPVLAWLADDDEDIAGGIL